MKNVPTLWPILIITLLITPFLIRCNGTAGPTPALDATIAQHFEAIKTRDIDKLLATVHKEGVTLVLPSGKHSTSYEAYKNVNIKWFSDAAWSIDYEIVEKTVRKETAVVLTKIHYVSKTSNGESKSFDYYLTLILEYNKGKWELVFDQNTVIQ